MTTITFNENYEIYAPGLSNELSEFLDMLSNTRSLGNILEQSWVKHTEVEITDDLEDQGLKEVFEVDLADFRNGLSNLKTQMEQATSQGWEEFLEEGYSEWTEEEIENNRGELVELYTQNSLDGIPVELMNEVLQY